MNQKKIKKATENGRSMVEMLGVLAIIGVLSVGGIAGYKSAITSHRANETIDRVLKRAVVIAGQVGLGQQADISGFNEEDGTYKILSAVDTTTTAGQFVITVESVPEEVCQKIKDMWTLPSIVPGNCEEGTNDMTFTFANDLSAGENGGNTEPTEPTCDAVCREGYTCTNGECLWSGGESNYCKMIDRTNPTNCAEWAKCPYASSGDNVTPYYNGVCATDPKQEIYCAFTTGTECASWGVCSYANSGDKIVGISGAHGVCATSENQEIYCKTATDGKCTYWDVCNYANTGDRVVQDGSGTGACASFSTGTIYCKSTDANGKCSEWAVCSKPPYSWDTGDSIIGIPNAKGSCGN